MQDAPIAVPVIDTTTGLIATEWALWFAQLKGISESYQFDNVMNLYSGTFTSDSPSAGYVAWDQIKLKYNGQKYAVSSNGNTNKKYLYWEPSSFRVISSSDTLPPISEYLVLIGVNDAGTFTPGDYSFQARVLAGLNPDGTVATAKAVSDSVATDNIENYHMADGSVALNLGDPLSPHFEIIPVDTDWHELDLSGIVPAGYRSVALRVSILTTSPITLYFRQLGNVYLTNADVYAAPAYNSFHTFTCRMDSNRKVEWKWQGATGSTQSFYATVGIGWM
jgi:hypothetical protein